MSERPLTRISISHFRHLFRCNLCCGPGCRGFKSRHSPECCRRPRSPAGTTAGLRGLRISDSGGEVGANPSRWPRIGTALAAAHAAHESALRVRAARRYTSASQGMPVLMTHSSWPGERRADPRGGLSILSTSSWVSGVPGALRELGPMYDLSSDTRNGGNSNHLEQQYASRSD